MNSSTESNNPVETANLSDTEMKKMKRILVGSFEILYIQNSVKEDIGPKKDSCMIDDDDRWMTDDREIDR